MIVISSGWETHVGIAMKINIKSRKDNHFKMFIKLWKKTGETHKTHRSRGYRFKRVCGGECFMSDKMQS